MVVVEVQQPPARFISQAESQNYNLPDRRNKPQSFFVSSLTQVSEKVTESNYGLIVLVNPRMLSTE